MIRSLRLAPQLFAIAALALAACESTPTATEAQGTPVDLFNTWTLVVLDGNALDSIVPQGAKSPYMTIAPDGKVSGSTGINSLGSQLDAEALTHGRFTLGPIMTTRKAGVPAMMVVETEFVDLLRKTETYTVKGSTLTLSRGTDALLVFKGDAKQAAPATLTPAPNNPAPK